MVTRLGLHGGPRGLYGDFSGKAAAAVQMSGSTGFTWTPSGDLDVEATLAGSTGWDTLPTASLDVEATLVGATGFTWTPTGNLVDLNAVVPSAAGGRRKRKARYVVEVDGQFIDVANIAEAESVLQNVRDLATESAERDVKTAIAPKPPKIRVKTSTGKVTTSVTLQREVKRTQKVVNQAYVRKARQVAQDLEISQLMIKKITMEDREDDDAAVMLLM